LENVVKVWATPIEQLGGALLEMLLASWADDEIGPTLRAILQTAAHEPATREKLRRVVEGSLMGRLATRQRRTRPAGPQWAHLVTDDGLCADALRLEDRAHRIYDRGRGHRRDRPKPAALRRWRPNYWIQ
jgi:hypothetical protein